MTFSDLRDLGGQTPPGGIVELFFPKWGWANGGRCCGQTCRTIFVEIALKRLELNAACRTFTKNKIKFVNFEL